MSSNLVDLVINILSIGSAFDTLIDIIMDRTHVITIINVVCLKDGRRYNNKLAYFYSNMWKNNEFSLFLYILKSTNPLTVNA